MYRLTAMIAFVFLCTSSPSMASLIAATASPKHTSVNLGEGRTIKIRWVISTDSAHKEGAYSAQAELIDSVTGSIIKSITSPLDTQEGAGPLHFEETLTITADEIKKWRDLGYRELFLKRVFSTTTEPPSSSETKVSISIDPSNTTPNWVLHDLQLTFKPQRFNPMIRQNTPLHVQASVGYSGQGKLKGRWLIAKVGPESNAIVYSQLAQTQRLLNKTEETFILSPKLPTQNRGKYIVRFCITEDNVSHSIEQASIDKLCPKPQFNTALEYEIIASNHKIEDIPQEAKILSENTEFTWKPVKNTVVYELQIHKASREETITSPIFHNRLLIPGSTLTTQLSTEIISTLIPGQHYTWCVTAYDQHGELIQQSVPIPFVYKLKGQKK